MKAVDISTQEISTLAVLPAGIIDGIETGRDGNFLVSQTAGKLYRITPAGAVAKLIDTAGLDRGAANFAFIGEKNIVVIPAFADNRVVSYQLAP